jgi:hypothetical protein
MAHRPRSLLADAVRFGESGMEPAARAGASLPAAARCGYDPATTIK